MNLSQVVRTIWSGTTPAARRARQGIKFGVLIALFAAIFWVVPVRDVYDALVNADPLYLFLGYLLVFPGGALRAAQMKLLIRRLEIALSVLQIFGINLAIKFYMLFLPNALVGSGLRWYKFSQPRGKSSEALAAVAFNRLLETFLVVVVGFGFWLLSGVEKLQVGMLWLLALIAGMVVVWVLITRISLPIYKWYNARDLYKGQKDLVKKLVAKIGELLFAVTTFGDFSVWELVVVILVGSSALLVGALSYMILGMAVGINLSYFDMGWIQSVVALTALLPLSIGEGFGYREISLVAILGAFGIGADVALAFSFIIFGRSVLQGLAGGVIEAVQTLQDRSQEQ